MPSSKHTAEVRNHPPAFMGNPWQPRERALVGQHHRQLMPKFREFETSRAGEIHKDSDRALGFLKSMNRKTVPLRRWC